MREIEHGSEMPVYRQVADAIRDDIEAGRLRPRRPLPSEVHLTQEFGVARDTIRRAIAHLAELGLVRTVAGRGTFVRARGQAVVEIEPGVRIFARRPTTAERDTMELADDEWVLVIERHDGSVEVLPADGAEVRAPGHA
ncbi:GntR family transcriptional regulator [Nonomuraea polychroma]|uniref:GntR family transcriptional regulator n=1 Tax=Nonomuraea polychroma TaxID=46176 RepID=UPI003D8CEF52